MRSAIISIVTLAQPSAGMQVVMDNPGLERAVTLSDLLKQTFIVTRDHDTNIIRLRELSMIHVLKAMALHLLLGNFVTNGVTNAYNEANSIDPSAFLPQRNLSLVKEVRSRDLNSRNELGMDVIDVHKTKMSMGITLIRIGGSPHFSCQEFLCSSGIIPHRIGEEKHEKTTVDLPIFDHASFRPASPPIFPLAILEF